MVMELFCVQQRSDPHLRQLWEWFRHKIEMEVVDLTDDASVKVDGTKVQKRWTCLLTFVSNTLRNEDEPVSQGFIKQL